MALAPHEIDHEFQQRCRDHVEQGMPAGQAPDLCRFPDRALAESGWALGHFPRRCSMTGRILADGEESLVEQLRRISAEMIAAEGKV